MKKQALITHFETQREAFLGYDGTVQAPFLLLVVLAVWFSGCGSQTVEPFREDERALLRLRADDVLTLERNQQYSHLYDRTASDQFRKLTGRRAFLKMARCLETTLGPVTSYEVLEPFQRPGKKNMVVVRVQAERRLGPVEEQLVFVQEGIDFRLAGLFWLTRRPEFKDCIQ